jgi:hypothetical protein
MEDRTFDRISRSLAGATSRRQALKLLGGGIAAGALGTVGVGQVATAQTPTPNLNAIPITGAIGSLYSFAGTFNLDRFANQSGQLVAIGTLTGTLTNLTTGVTQAVNQVVQLPVTSATGSCEILDLTLGPINLDLLGLVVTTNAIHVNITAQQGPGKLLGNLLCAVANLLNNSNSPLGALAGLLNRILGQLGA